MITLKSRLYTHLFNSLLIWCHSNPGVVTARYGHGGWFLDTIRYCTKYRNAIRCGPRMLCHISNCMLLLTLHIQVRLRSTVRD